jgi:hypothetical protein
MGESENVDTARPAPESPSAPGRLADALRGLLNRWFGDEGLSRQHASSEVLLIEALHIAQRRGRLEFARTLLLHRAQVQVHAVEAVLEMGVYLQAHDEHVKALQEALEGARRLLILLCHKSRFALALPQQGHCPRRASSV